MNLSEFYSRLKIFLKWDRFEKMFPEVALIDDDGSNQVVECFNESSKTFYWHKPEKDYIQLHFQKAFAITSKTSIREITGVKYRVRRRSFTELDFTKGTLISHIFDDPSYIDQKILQHKDGTKFLFQHERLPLFDSDDAEYGSEKEFIIYRDIFGFNIIECYHGYKVARITIYLKMKEQLPELKKLLK